MKTLRFLGILALASVSIFAFADDEPGHSTHGSAFDSGMRTKPWIMPGIGDTPMPITSKNPEVQKWFNQGVALLHSFWFEEAERSFRWCLKLDPDCAMAYWGLARCGFNWFTIGSPNYDDKQWDRYKTFLKEAVRREDKVTDREKMYIQAWADAYGPDANDRGAVIVDRLQAIVVKYPDDVEAKALLALHNIWRGSAYANQALINEVLAKNPMHPGALHASIHNWGGPSPEQAIKACELYGKAAPGIGHALHMPGHIYSKVGMWHEAAIAMDSATRIELRYMNDRVALPFETWNYPHNRNYLCYIQEQLGMANDALQGAKDMLSAPRDPDYNPDKGGDVVSQGHAALVRNLVKYEKWDQILEPGVVTWDSSSDFGKLEQAFNETLAYINLKRMQEARERMSDLNVLATKLKDASKGPNQRTQMVDMIVNLTQGELDFAEGNMIDSQREMLNAADAEQHMRDGGGFTNDPPEQPWPIIRLLGDQYRSQGENKLAIDCYERALKNEPNDGFTLSGLAQAYYAMGNKEKATHYAGMLAYVWSEADPHLKWMEDVQKLRLNAKPVAETIRKERMYHPAELDKLGPMNWQPFSAPALQVLDKDGKSVTLKDYSGKNVVLVYFLGDACVHCIAQLKALNDRSADFDANNTVLLAVCSSTPDKIKAVATDDKVTFLSDKDHENARRFSSYDDFENIELHSTILIDKNGKVRWKRTGGDPFSNVDFLIGEIKRVNDAK